MNRATYAAISRSRTNPTGNCHECGTRCGHDALHCTACMDAWTAAHTCPDCGRTDANRPGRCAPCNRTNLLETLRERGESEERIAQMTALLDTLNG